MKKYATHLRAHLSASPNLFQSPDVEFCAYSIPHPSENVMNIRIQTYSEPARPPSFLPYEHH